MPARYQAWPKVRFCTENQAQSTVVLGDEPADFASTIPVRDEFKKVLNLNNKKDRFLLIRLIWSVIPSSFFLCFSNMIDTTRVFFCKYFLSTQYQSKLMGEFK
jgi:hypothetical protein